MSQAAGWPHEVPPFHPGERAAQARAGVDLRMHEVGSRVMRAAMPDQHRELFHKLPFMLLGALDARRRPWATLLAGAPGFVRTPDATTLELGARPLGEGTIPIDISLGAPVGLLGIEPATRRRNRVNGVVRRLAPDGLVVEVSQSFGNCPKYIQARDLHAERRTPDAPLAFGPDLPAPALRLLAAADMLFIASASGAAGLGSAAAHEGVDVSHRGGLPGFAQVAQQASGSRVTLPDYVGNFFFNTVGNIESQGRAGLLAVDWTRGDLLSFTAKARVAWDDPALARYAGAQRLIHLEVEEGRWLPAALPLRGGEVRVAPQFAAPD